MAFGVSDVLPSPVLTRLAVELFTGGPYIADIIAPVAKVERDSYRYAIFGREDIKDDVLTSKAPGDGAEEVDFTKTYASSTVQYHKLKSRIPDQIRANDPQNSIDRRRTTVLSNKLRLGIERRFAALLAAASNTQTTPSTKWSTNSTATPRKDILAAKSAFRQLAGVEPNVMVMGPSVRDQLFSCSDILDHIRYSSDRMLQQSQLPQLLNMNVVVPGAIVDTANPGAAASIADAWAAKEAYYLWVDPTAGDDLEAQTALRQVRSVATGKDGIYVKKYRDAEESAESDFVSVHVNQDELVVTQNFILRHLAVIA